MRKLFGYFITFLSAYTIPPTLFILMLTCLFFGFDMIPGSEFTFGVIKYSALYIFLVSVSGLLIRKAVRNAIVS